MNGASEQQWKSTVLSSIVSPSSAFGSTWVVCPRFPSRRPLILKSCRVCFFLFLPRHFGTVTNSILLLLLLLYAASSRLFFFSPQWIFHSSLWNAATSHRFSLLFFISYFISFQFKYAHLFNIWSTFAVVEAVVLFTNLSGRVRVVPLSCFHTIYVGRVLLLLLLAYLQRVQTTGGRLLAKFYTFNGRPRVEQQSRTAPQGRRRRLW